MSLSDKAIMSRDAETKPENWYISYAKKDVREAVKELKAKITERWQTQDWQSLSDTELKADVDEIFGENLI